MESPESGAGSRAQPPERPLTIVVEVVHCPAHASVDRHRIELQDGATVADALQSSGIAERHPQWQPAGERAGVGIHGRLVSLDTRLQHGDRVELYRPLQVEPKEARRARQRAQKTASAPRRGPPAAG